jgi:hypothetical protein
MKLARVNKAHYPVQNHAQKTEQQPPVPHRKVNPVSQDLTLVQ